MIMAGCKMFPCCVRALHYRGSVIRTFTHGKVHFVVKGELVDIQPEHRYILIPRSLKSLLLMLQSH